MHALLVRGDARCRRGARVPTSHHSTPSRHDTAAKVRVGRLLREARVDLQALGRIEAELADARARLGEQPADRPLQALVAVDLHDLYTAIESLFERIARSIDGEVPAGADWHRGLVYQMAAEIPGLRPALLDDDDVALLDRVRGFRHCFRHFFRHAYGVALDAERLCEHADAWLAASGRPTRGVEAYLDALRASVSQR